MFYYIFTINSLTFVLLAVKTLPVVSEVVPPTGVVSGNTRVAILGNNFVDTPTTRVRFDNVMGMSFKHRPTLIQ